MQPVRLADVVEGLARPAIQIDTDHGIISMTGSQILTLTEYLATLRQTLHHRLPQHILPAPLRLTDPALSLASLLSNSIISRDDFALLK